ncbi:unnamed protein product [Lupinus luteus]|uniref:Reverse transcriptase zinc-binding domain-containing protein n=1 Tax=Lupinus luteus TaxID=3873 RepID=A0AAV1WMG4_LUPLU
MSCIIISSNLRWLQVTLENNRIDGWILVHDKGGFYSVQNAYKVLLNEASSHDNGFFKKLWACNVPSTLRCLVWKLSLDGVATLSNLDRCGVLGDRSLTGCAFCGVLGETVEHLFFSCAVTYRIWQKLYSWFGLCSVISNDVKSNFISHWNLMSLDKNHHQQ